MDRLLKMEPLERMTAKEELLHPFFSDYYDRPQTTASISRTDSVNARGRCPNPKNKRGYLMSNPIGETKRTYKIKEEISLSPHLLKESKKAYEIQTKTSTNKDSVTVKFRSSPFNNEGEIRLDRQKSREGIKHPEGNEGKVIRKEKSFFEENQMCNINEEDDAKVSPRLKPMTIKKR